MIVRVGRYAFDDIDYDDDPMGDVMYLRNQHYGMGVGDFITPEGHVWMHPDNESPVVGGLIIMTPRLCLDEDGDIYVTTPEGERVVAEGAADVVRAARAA